MKSNIVLMAITIFTEYYNLLIKYFKCIHFWNEHINTICQYVLYKGNQVQLFYYIYIIYLCVTPSWTEQTEQEN